MSPNKLEGVQTTRFPQLVSAIMPVAAITIPPNHAVRVMGLRAKFAGGSTMNYTYYDSSSLSQFIAWFFCIPTIFYVIMSIGNVLFIKEVGVTRLLLIWLGICAFLFSPLRYLIFQILVAQTYAVQSFSSFFNTIILSLYVPFIAGILYAIGFAPAMVSALAICSKKPTVSLIQGLLLAFVFPFACMLGTYLFFLALPSAAWTLRWVDEKDLIKATNGPPALAFQYLIKPFGLVSMPAFYELTPRSDKDLLRCHFAATYLSNQGLARFKANQYPDLR